MFCAALRGHDSLQVEMHSAHENRRSFLILRPENTSISLQVLCTLPQSSGYTPLTVRTVLMLSHTKYYVPVLRCPTQMWNSRLKCQDSSRNSPTTEENHEKHPSRYPGQALGLPWYCAVLFKCGKVSKGH